MQPGTLAIGMALFLGSTGCHRSEQSVVAGGDVERGRTAIAATGCGACHEISGVSGAQGRVGPPLTGVASRSILAGELPNTPENMIRWVENPQAINPNTAMPNLGVTPASAKDIAAYLYTLR
jgi:cytochrome c